MPTLSNVKGIIPSLATPNTGVWVLRASAPVQDPVYGSWTRPAPTKIWVTPIVVHNVAGRDLAQQPWADQNVETIELYSYVRFYVSDDGQSTDVVLYNGRQWEIKSSLDYALQGGCWISFGQLLDKQKELIVP